MLAGDPGNLALRNRQTNWRVLLLGGCSGVGKTVVAQQLSQELNVPHLLVDDIRIAIQAVTDPIQLPALHFFLQTSEPAQLPSADFVAGLVGVGQALIPALQGVIEHHVAVAGAGRIILEGDGILPALMAQLSLHDVRGDALPEPRSSVKCLFLDEPDEQVLLHNFQQRDRGFNRAAGAEQRAYVHSVWQYGRWLAAAAQRAGLPLVTSRPFATVNDRALAAINKT